VEYFDYNDDPRAGPLVSFTFSTFRGIAAFFWIEEHRGFLHPDRAVELLGELHRKNLSFWGWIAGLPGFFPLVSLLTYRSQLKRIRRQVAAGQPWPLPGTDTRSERRATIVFVGVVLIALAVIFGWAWLDPEGFSKLAERVQRR
jgi:hypothetical protein